MALKDELSKEETLIALEDLIGTLQELHYRLESIDDFEAYGVRESLLASIAVVLERYDSFD